MEVLINCDNCKAGINFKNKKLLRILKIRVFVIRKFSFLILLALSTVFIGCDEKIEIHGEWFVNSLLNNGENVLMVDCISFDFKEGGEYIQDNSVVETKGEWKVMKNGKELYTKTTLKNGAIDEKLYSIISVASDSLILGLESTESTESTELTLTRKCTVQR